MKTLEAIKAEKVTVTLTLGEIDALVKCGRFVLDDTTIKDADIEKALAVLDEAVNG